MNATPTLALVAAAVALASCDADGPVASTRIDRPRLLAVAADPPVLDLTRAATTATISALVVDATGDAVDPAAASLAARACSPWTAVADPARDCPPEAALLLPRTDDGTITLDAAAVLARFPAPAVPPTGAAAPTSCPFDYDWIAVPLVVEATVAGSRLTARKEVRLAVTPATRRNPGLGDLTLDGIAARDYYEVETSYEISVRPSVDTLDDTCDPADPAAIVPESLSIYLYATAGDLDGTHVDARYDAAGVESLDTLDFVAPPAGPVVIWAVAIDPDGGASWKRIELLPR